MNFIRKIEDVLFFFTNHTPVPECEFYPAFVPLVEQLLVGVISVSVVKIFARLFIYHTQVILLP